MSSFVYYTRLAGKVYRLLNKTFELKDVFEAFLSSRIVDAKFLCNCKVVRFGFDWSLRPTIVFETEISERKIGRTAFSRTEH